MVSHPNSSLNPQKSDDGCVEHCERAKKTKTVFGYLSALAPLQLDLDAPHRVRKTTSPLSHLLSDTSHTVSPWSTPTPTPTSQRHPFASAWFGYASKETNSRTLLLSRPNVRPNVRPSERKTLRRRARARHRRHRRRHHRRRDRSSLARYPAHPRVRRRVPTEVPHARLPGSTVDAFDPGVTYQEFPDVYQNR
jgi:hypothetical protein